AEQLAARGVAKSDRVLLWGPNSGAWVAAFFACAYRGVVAVPMDEAATPDFALRVMRQVQAKLIVCSREHASSEIPTTLFEEFYEHRNCRGALAPEALSGDDILQIVFTSGTIGDPKGVVITPGNVLANVAPLQAKM